MSKKTYYYFIDESGHINNDQNVFLYGCIKTDTPNLSESVIAKLKEDLKDELYFVEYEKQIEKGFHACENHPDIKTHFYKLLPLLNFRAYFEVLYKESEYFRKLKLAKQDYEVIAKMLENLIRRMILKNRRDKHHFFIEELKVKDKPLKNILQEIFDKYHEFDVEYEIVSKGNNNLSITDYINYNVFNIFEPDEEIFSKNKRVKQTFNILKEKIALIHIWNNISFLSRRGKKEELVEIDNLRKVMAEA
ncbi:DUF3800 domain-containing protein [Flavobacterium sp. DGU11]|uniref:DUF3800 domain-containing protein n=1 Tax=Flavobacterium arundinis TaxID=3139143 RepID=A0ABU9HRL1_9FLAO